MNKKIAIVLSVFLVSCTEQNISGENNFTIKTLTESASPSRPPEDFRNNPNLTFQSVSSPSPSPSSPAIASSLVNKQEKFVLDKYEQDYPSKDSIVPGMISVIYKNNYKFKVNRKTRKLEANDVKHSDEVSSILNKHKLREVNDLMPDNADQVKLANIQKDLSSKFGMDFPELSSLHSYVFPEDTDTIKLAEELRKLPYVETAYPTQKVVTSSTPSPNFIARQGMSDIHRPTPPYTNDTGFSRQENNDWGWFNHHKIFQAWSIYSSAFGWSDITQVSQADKPVIAVIDDGFYKASSVDAPTYLTGAHFSYSGAYLDTNTDPHTQYNPYNTDKDLSHGTAMANIIGSPKNNSIGLCGVIPGAKIYPLKIDYKYNSTSNVYELNSDAMVAAINKATTMNGTNGNPNVDVISASLVITINSKDQPISFNSTVNSAIQYAIAQNKSVVLSSGNTNTNLDTYTTPFDYGAIVVGGSDRFKGTKWEDNTLEGSGFGNTVDISADAKQVSACTWNVRGNNVTGLVYNTGVSPSTAIVAGVVGMAKKLAEKKGFNYTPKELREVIAHTGTLGVSSNPPPAIGSKKFLGRGLSDGNNNINLYAEMRDLNAWAALTVINNANYPKLTRVFNNDDYTYPTTNDDWAGRYSTENYFDDAFWGFPNPLPANTRLTFQSFNTGGNGSLGYQIYTYGKFDKERIYGVLSRYNTSMTASNLSNQYFSIGTSLTNEFGRMGW